jgi:hypothetical protein
MNTFLQTLIAAGDIPEAYYIKFLNQYKFSRKTLHVFVEGQEDQSFYVNYIENIYDSDYEPFYYVVSGKDNIYTTYNYINWSSYNCNRVLFFTDKDVDDLIGKRYIVRENIFVTKYYSIENYLVKPEVYKRFLRELCLINDDVVIEELIRKFNQQLQIFHEMMLAISSWIIYCRKYGLELNLNDVDMYKIITIDSNFKIYKVVPPGYKGIFDYIFASIGIRHLKSSEIQPIYRALKTLPAKEFIRGKFELCFLYLFCKNTIDITVPQLNTIIKAHNRSNSKKMPKCKVQVQLKPENLIQVIAPRVRVEGDILKFLNSNYNKLVAT